MSAPDFTIFGASGQIGAALTEHLRAQGHSVRAIARHDGGDGLPLDGPLGHAIFAIGVTADFRTRPFDTMDAHVSQVTRLLRGGDFASLTYLSSTRVYEGNAETHEDAALSVQPASPSALYNISKLAGESVCLNSGRANVRVVRLSNVVGGRPGADSFLDQLIAEGRAQGQVRLRSHPASQKDYIAMADALALVTQIAAAGRHSIYNVASGVQTANAQVLDVLGGSTGWPMIGSENGPLVSFPPIETGRIRDEFGFVPQPFAAYFAAHIARVLPSRPDHPKDSA